MSRHCRCHCRRCRRTSTMVGEACSPPASSLAAAAAGVRVCVAAAGTEATMVCRLTHTALDVIALRVDGTGITTGENLVSCAQQGHARQGTAEQIARLSPLRQVISDIQLAVGSSSPVFSGAPSQSHVCFGGASVLPSSSVRYRSQVDPPNYIPKGARIPAIESKPLSRLQTGWESPKHIHPSPQPKSRVKSIDDLCLLWIDALLMHIGTCCTMLREFSNMRTRQKLGPPLRQIPVPQTQLQQVLPHAYRVPLLCCVRAAASRYVGPHLGAPSHFRTCTELVLKTVLGRLFPSRRQVAILGIYHACCRCHCGCRHIRRRARQGCPCR